MKKNTKHDTSMDPQQSDVDIVTLLAKIQQQLTFLEKKIDILISQPSGRPSEEKHFSKPFQRFDRHDNYGKGRQDDGSRERSFTKVICSDCNKECEVPFRPSGDRPVYCRDCFSKHKEGSSFSRGKHDSRSRESDFAPRRHFDKHPGEETRKSGKRKKPSFLRRKER